MEDLISENDHQRSLLKGREGWERRHKAPALTLYIRNKKANTNKLCEFSKDLYNNNLLVTLLYFHSPFFQIWFLNFLFIGFTKFFYCNELYAFEIKLFRIHRTLQYFPKSFQQIFGVNKCKYMKHMFQLRMKD